VRWHDQQSEQNASGFVEHNGSRITAALQKSDRVRANKDCENIQEHNPGRLESKFDESIGREPPCFLKWLRTAAELSGQEK